MKASSSVNTAKVKPSPGLPTTKGRFKREVPEFTPYDTAVS